MKTKKIFISMVIGMMFFILSSGVQANMVTLKLSSVGDYEISAFNFYFLSEKPYSHPLDYNWQTFESDFQFDFGSAVPYPNGWQAYTLITSEGDNDYARGMTGGSLSTGNTALKLQDGILLTMSSTYTMFAADLNVDAHGTQNFQFLDFNDEIIPSNYRVTATWDGDNQNVVVDFAAAPVPLPPSVLLTASGLIGLVGIRRRKNNSEVMQNENPLL